MAKRGRPKRIVDLTAEQKEELERWTRRSTTAQAPLFERVSCSPAPMVVMISEVAESDARDQAQKRNALEHPVAGDGNRDESVRGQSDRAPSPSSLTASAPSSCRKILCSSKRSATSSGSTCPRRSVPWCCASMRSLRFKRSIAPSRCCP